MLVFHMLFNFTLMILFVSFLPQLSNTLSDNNFSIDVETKEDKKTGDIQAKDIKTIEDTSDLINDVFVTKGILIYNKLRIIFV